MSDQPEADESLPTPTPDETARSMREGSRSRVLAWKRLLPPWAVSIGLHMFLLPFVLGLTVVFADSLFVPTVWNDVREEKGSDVPLSLMIENRDLPVEDVQEKAVTPSSERFPHTDASQRADNTPVQTQLETKPGPSPLETDSPRIVVAGTLSLRSVWFSKSEQGYRTRLTVKRADGKHVTFDCDESSVAIEDTSPSGSLDLNRIPYGGPVVILGVIKDGKNVARQVFARMHPETWPEPQASSDGNVVIEQPKESTLGTDRVRDVIVLRTPQKVIDEMLRLAELKPNEILFDLGSGDGRIPITAAKQFGARGFGYEIDAQWIKWSLEKVKEAGAENRVVIERRDLFKLDLSKADVVSAYLLPSMMVKLIPQFEQMKPDSRLVVQGTPFFFDARDDWNIKPDKVVEIDAPDHLGITRSHKIYLWTMPFKKEKLQK
jgi:hypothetical protein